MTAAVSSVPRRIASGVGSLLIAVVLLVGVPVLLWQLAGWPLPTQVPTPEQFGHALSRSSVSDGVIIKTLKRWQQRGDVVFALGGLAHDPRQIQTALKAFHAAAATKPRTRLS